MAVQEDAADDIVQQSLPMSQWGNMPYFALSILANEDSTPIDVNTQIIFLDEVPDISDWYFDTELAFIGTLPEIIDVCECAVSGGVSQLFTYQGKAIFDSSSGGRHSAWIVSNANAQIIVRNQTQFSEIGSIAHDGPPISVVKYEDDTSVTDTIGSNEVPGDAICIFASSPKFKVS